MNALCPSVPATITARARAGIAESTVTDGAPPLTCPRSLARSRAARCTPAKSAGLTTTRVAWLAAMSGNRPAPSTGVTYGSGALGPRRCRCNYSGQADER